MTVTVSDMQNTLLQLFRDRGLSCGEEVTLAGVEQLWAATTLRRGDLLDAVVRNTATGLLAIEDRDGDTLLALTADGETAAAQLSQPGSISWNQYLHTVLLPGVRQRHLPAAPAGRGRRSYENRTDAQNHALELRQRRYA